MSCMCVNIVSNHRTCSSELYGAIFVPMIDCTKQLELTAPHTLRQHDLLQCLLAVTFRNSCGIHAG